MVMHRLRLNAEKYCHDNSCELFDKAILGAGEDGEIWRTCSDTAVKAFYREKNYVNELECYRRLHSSGWTQIDGLAVPLLEGSSDDLLIIEITIVQPPRILDFGKVYIDRPPPYWKDELVIKDLNDRIDEHYGENAARVHLVLHKLKSLGIYYADPRPGNIDF